MSNTGELVEFSDALDGDFSDKIVVSLELESENLVRSFVKLNCTSWVQKNSDYFDIDFDMTKKMRSDSAAYFQKGSQFFIEDELSSLKIQFNSETNKENLRTKVAEAIENLKPASVKESIEAIFEEMYMNATYDAPREAEKKGLAVSCIENEIVISYNEKYCAISCKDFCASLDLAKCFNRMNEVYSRGVADSINMKQGSGAGIGCVIMLEHAHSLVFGIWKGKMTVVTALVPINISNKQRSELKKNLHRIVKI